MNLIEAKTILHRTHLAALATGVRAGGVHMESGPGVGKSDAVYQSCGDLARAVKEPIGLVTFMLATITSPDVRGFMLPTKPAEAGGMMGTLFSQPPWFPTRENTVVFEPSTGEGSRDGVIVHAEGTWTGPVPRVGVLFLDEFSQAEDDVKKPAAELVYKGAVGTARLPIGWRVVSAGNRMKDRSGVLRELMFIVNRRLRLEIDASLDAWRRWAMALPDASRPHFLTMSFAERNPDVVFQETIPDGADPFCTPRSLCQMDWELRALRAPEVAELDLLPTDDLSREVAAGRVGKGAAAQFFTHIKYAEELPTLDEIVTDPMRAKLPPKRDAQMVAAFMLVHNAGAANINPVVTYMERLAVEMQALTMRNLITRPDVASAILVTPAVNRWLAKHKDLILAASA
jgi:hypothetical protein